MAASSSSPVTRRFAIWALLGTTALWGLSFPLGKALTLLHEAMAPDESGWFVTVSTIWPRFLLASLLLLPLSAHALRSAKRREIVQGVGLATFMSAGLLLQVDGLRFTEASTSAFLSQGYVVWLPIFVFGRLRRWPPLVTVLSTCVVLAGVAILAGVNVGEVRIGRGEAETLISTLFFTGQILWLEREAFHGNRPSVVTFVMFTTCAALSAIVGLVLASEPRAMVQPLRSVAWLSFTAALAVFCTFGAIWLMNSYQRFLTATEAGLIYAAEPVWASLITLFLPAWLSSWSELAYANESLTQELLVGGTLICAANVIMQLKPPQATAAADGGGG